jgi:hypothetical protein
MSTRSESLAAAAELGSAAAELVAALGRPDTAAYFGCFPPDRAGIIVGECRLDDALTEAVSPASDVPVDRGLGLYRGVAEAAPGR